MENYFSIKSFLQDESGVTSVEYALLAAAAAGVFTVAGTSFYTKISTALEGVLPQSGETPGPF